MSKHPDPSSEKPDPKQPILPPGRIAAEPEEVVQEITDAQQLPDEEPKSIEQKVKTLLVGRPLNLEDKSVYHHISLVAFLAWVGLGADGLSSSCYGPSEAFHHLLVTDHVTHEVIVDHKPLAVFLALATIFTVVIISLCYSRIIAAFPSGGGGYLVASKCLGRGVGVVSGCALVVDYVLTVTVSIAAAGDALVGLLGPALGQWKVPLEMCVIVFLVLLNLRGVKESVTFLMPIFLVFLATHILVIGGALLMHSGSTGEIATHISEHVQFCTQPGSSIGWMGMIGALMYAYSLGAGTYTGIEAVSNSMPVMREPKVATAQRTMIYMALSLALTAGGLMVAYLLMKLGSASAGGMTMNHVLTTKFVEELGFGNSYLGATFIWITILSEGALLVVAAQAGFIDGPRVLANMAHDSWVPHWFGSLSERLATHNGIILIGAAALVALWANNGNVSTLVIMYSINVFLTFSLSMIGMCFHWYQLRDKDKTWWQSFALFAFGGTMCLSILAVTIWFKFFEGGWITIFVTGLFCGLCYLVKRYYETVTARLKGLDESLTTVAAYGPPNLADPDHDAPTAAILVGGYSGLGVHTLLNSARFVPGYFKNMVFISVGVVDSGNFKGAEEVERLKQYCEDSLEQYVDLSRRLGLPARGYMSIGTDVVDELEQVCRVVARDFPKSVVFAGQLVFQRETWYGHLLHNQTAYSLQRRLQWDGIPMVILPTRVRGS